MTAETESLNAKLTTAQIFSRLLPDTPQNFLTLIRQCSTGGARQLCGITWFGATTRFLVSGDGACAGYEKICINAVAQQPKLYATALS